MPVSLPVIEATRGGTVEGTLRALNRILDLTLPEYNNWMTMVHDRVKALVDEKLSAAEVIAARPTLDFDALYDGNPAWTGVQFTQTIYQELTAR